MWKTGIAVLKRKPFTGRRIAAIHARTWTDLKRAHKHCQGNHESRYRQQRNNILSNIRHCETSYVPSIYAICSFFVLFVKSCVATCRYGNGLPDFRVNEIGSAGIREQRLFQRAEGGLWSGYHAGDTDLSTMVSLRSMRAARS
jgi:hypothetical protein